MRISDWSSDVCSSDLSSEVRGAGAPVFPDLATATFAGGTYPNVDNLRAIAPGMTKDQLYDLIGRPHFHEGVFGVREWNYLFHFRDADGNASACQYQVRFDADALVASTHWKPSTCARSEEHTSELQSLMRISSAVFCLKK